MVAVDGVTLFSQSTKRTAKPVKHIVKRQHQDSTVSSEQPLPDGTVPAAKQNGEHMLAPKVLAEQADATFKSLGLSDWLNKLCKSLGMAQPTEVQIGCIPSILAGRDVIGTAHTGSGKTAAFALPILQRLAQDPFGVYALVLTPTRYL